MTALYAISVIASIVCFIMVLVQLFKAKGALHGILGLICGLYTFIWGWINGKALNLTKIMIIWTASMVLSWIAGGAVAMTQLPALQKQMEEAAKAQQAAPAPAEVPVPAPAPAPAPIK